MTRPYGRAQSQAVREAATPSRASRAASVSRSATRSATATNTRVRPSGVRDQPGQRGHPGEGAGLGAHQAAAVGLTGGEPELQRAGEAGHGQPADHRPQLGVLGRGRHPQHVDQGGRPDPGAAREAAAVVHAVRRQVDPEVGERGRHAAPGGGEGALPLDRQPDVVGEDLGGLVVAHVEDVLDDLGERCAADHREVGRGARGRTRGDPPAHGDAGPAQRCRVDVRGVRRRVGDPPVAPGRAAAVDPERRDRRDDLVGQVVRLPGGAGRGTGEEPVVVAQPHGADAALAERRRGEPGQADHVGARGVRRPVGGLAREVGVAAPDQHQPPARPRGHDAGGEDVVRPQGGEGRRRGQQLGGRGRHHRPRVALGDDGRVRRESADHGHRVLAQVGVGEAGGDRAPHPRRGRAHRLGVGHRDRRGLDEVGQGQPLRRGHGGGLGERIGVREPVLDVAPGRVPAAPPRRRSRPRGGARGAAGRGVPSPATLCQRLRAGP